MTTDAEKEAIARIHLVQKRNEEKLNLSSLGLEVIPAQVFEISSLISLNLSSNQLTNIPEEIGRLSGLTHLNLQDNQLSHIDGIFSDLGKLKSLDVSKNLLTCLPEDLCQVSNLAYLDLSKNKLTSLSESIGKLRSLALLYLSRNQLTCVPESIGLLHNLLRLYLDYNKLTNLPTSIGQLSSLKELYLQSNQLSTLPDTLNNILSLQSLDLHENETLIIPDEVLKSGSERNKLAKPADILAFYFESLKGRDPLNEARLILVGHGDVGKTSIVDRLVNDNFEPQVKTEGINITKWPITLHNDEILLHIWDFGGQEIMHSTHQFFMTHRSLYLLVLSGRTGHEDVDVEYWLKTIESFGGDSPVIVVLNKIKEHQFDLNRGALIQKYSFIRGFIETDCKDSTGIKELKSIIERETDQLPHLRDMFPSAWFSIKTTLSNMEDNYISFDSFRKLCRGNGEASKNTQESLARYLHNNLGIALNYRDDPRLRHTHVLNPQWVTKGIYSIINAKILAIQRGIISLSDLPQILDINNYPEDRHSFLFDLMQKFELCYSYPDEVGKYLVPELLRKEQPKEAELFNVETCLNFEYTYPIVPEGLLPRFIVRTHPLIKKNLRWKSGVILEFEGNTALIKSDTEEKKVAINVTGSQNGRRRLLAIIRSDFDRIHSSYSFMPEERVPLPNRADITIGYRELTVLESKGLKSYPLVIGDEIINVDVTGLLEGVDLIEKRTKEPTLGKNKRALRLFYSYSHKDEKLRDELETHLKILNRKGLITSWHDRKILPGARWGNEIDQNLEQADIILLLVSADFLASDYCYDVEMMRALRRHEKRTAVVVPIIIRDVDFKNAPFSNLQALPKNARAVTKWNDQDSAWRDVEEGIERLVGEISSGKRL